MQPRIALAGYGYWGPNLLRNLVGNSGCQVVGVAEPSQAARERCARIYPSIPVFASFDELLQSQKPDAVVIATPPGTHRDIAVKAIRAGAHVLVEKPLALSVSECDEILAEAQAHGKHVMVDHTFVYNPAVQYLHEHVLGGSLGDLLYYDSVRVNLGGFQPQTNVLWDLAPHDLSILDYFTGGKVPVAIAAHGIKHFDAGVENLAYLHLSYENKFVAHLHLNWVAPVKIRQVMVGGTRKMAVYDENLPAEKVKIYDKNVALQKSGTPNDFSVSYRVGDMVAPAISNKEALAGMIGQFITTITTGKAGASDGQSGRRVVQILEAASLSMSLGGKPVELDKLVPAKRKLRRVA